jgi:hypothetical protein
MKLSIDEGHQTLNIFAKKFLFPKKTKYPAG